MWFFLVQLELFNCSPGWRYWMTHATPSEKPLIAILLKGSKSSNVLKRKLRTCRGADTPTTSCKPLTQILLSSSLKNASSYPGLWSCWSYQPNSPCSPRSELSPGRTTGPGTSFIARSALACWRSAWPPTQEMCSECSLYWCFDKREGERGSGLSAVWKEAVGKDMPW